MGWTGRGANLVLPRSTRSGMFARSRCSAFVAASSDSNTSMERLGAVPPRPVTGHEPHTGGKPESVTADSSGNGPYRQVRRIPVTPYSSPARRPGLSVAGSPLIQSREMEHLADR